MSDKTQKKKTKLTGGQVFAVALYMILGGIFGFIAEGHVISLLEKHAPTHTVIFTAAGLTLVLILAFYIQIIIHELGHLLFGLATGYRFVSFRVGSLMLIKQDKVFKLRRFAIMGTGGQCLMDPPEYKNGTYPYKLYNLGGIILNLTASLLCFVIFLLFGSNFTVFFASLITFLIGIIFAAVNGIPMRMGMLDNDGCNALNLSSHPDIMRCLWLQLKINALITKGTRLRDMPDELFPELSEEERKKGLCAVIGVFACNRAMDGMDFPLAERLARELLESSGIVPLHRYILTAELIYCELVGENRREVLDGYRSSEFQRFEKAMKAVPLFNPHAIRLGAAREQGRSGSAEEAGVL
ncbi:MAG: M50 family metallopeptidase [Eubacteriales bacterium]